MADKTAITVRGAVEEDEAPWRRLWKGYISFYESSVPDGVTDVTWDRIIDPEYSVGGLVACEGDKNGPVIGILNYVVHWNTWMIPPVCYLEDLFVDPAARGRGAGRALIDGLSEIGHELGWGRIYWRTKADNDAARALYEKIVPASDWITYEIRND